MSESSDKSRRKRAPNRPVAMNFFSRRSALNSGQHNTAEDILKSQTVGLVQHSDFRKRRAEAIEQKELEAQDSLRDHFSDVSNLDCVSLKKDTKKSKITNRGKLSFLIDDADEFESPSTKSDSPSTLESVTSSAALDNDCKMDSATITSNPSTTELQKSGNDADEQKSHATRGKMRLKPNSTAPLIPRVLTRTALIQEAQIRERLRREFLQMQERVKATEFVIPFIFFDGTSMPGGRCIMRKGDHVWLFLDRARKLGAELGVGGDKIRKAWARVGVDDLILVRDEIIIPHHYDFYYFIVNKVIGYHGRLFNMSAEPTGATPVALMDSSPASYDPLTSKKSRQSIHLNNLEGAHDDPKLTKVVDRRWYERNKHIFPASLWEEFDPLKDYTNGVRKDSQGNVYFIP